MRKSQLFSATFGCKEQIEGLKKLIRHHDVVSKTLIFQSSSYKIGIPGKKFCHSLAIAAFSTFSRRKSKIPLHDLIITATAQQTNIRFQNDTAGFRKSYHNHAYSIFRRACPSSSSSHHLARLLFQSDIDTVTNLRSPKNFQLFFESLPILQI